MAVTVARVHTHTHTQANLINNKKTSMKNALLVIKETILGIVPLIGARKCEPIRTVLNGFLHLINPQSAKAASSLK